MDLGVITACKRGCRKLILRAIINDIESRAARRDLNDNLRAGMKGLREGYEPHITGVAQMTKTG